MNFISFVTILSKIDLMFLVESDARLISFLIVFAAANGFILLMLTSMLPVLLANLGTGGGGRTRAGGGGGILLAVIVGVFTAVLTNVLTPLVSVGAALEIFLRNCNNWGQI